ncbi:MAG: F0F1 ATP synthase subunit B [Planctomycetes bacterium]|nr:F0F1 ATP synthase subunit B [Planctomycetota bacterium]
MRKSTIFITLLLLLSTCCAFASEPPLEDKEQLEVSVIDQIFSGYFGESIWTLIAFAVLLLVLSKFAWPPMLAGLQARHDHIEKQISDADKIRADAEQTLAEYREKLAGVDKEGKSIIAEYSKKAELQGKESLEKTQKELEAMKLKAQIDIAHQQTEAKSEFWKQAGSIVLRLGKQVFSRAMTHEDNQHLIDDAIRRLKMEEKEETSATKN